MGNHFSYFGGMSQGYPGILLMSKGTKLFWVSILKNPWGKWVGYYNDILHEFSFLEFPYDSSNKIIKGKVRELPLVESSGKLVR
jgi:hypothetical protein